MAPMTLAAACGWSLFRSLIVALAAWPVCKSQVAWLAGMERRQRRLAWLVLLIPFLCPELWAGFAWSGFAVRLAGTSFWGSFPFGLVTWPLSAIESRDAAVNELLLDLLLFFRAVPVGTVAMYFAPPPPLSREAWYCRELARIRTRSASEGVSDVGAKSLPRWRFGLVWRDFLDRLRFGLYGRFYTAIPAASLLFLVAFQEFELASLIGRPAWTVWLFDAQAGGLALSESLRLIVLPVVCQCVVIAPLLWMILTRRSNPSMLREHVRPKSQSAQMALWIIALGGVAVTCVVPAIQVGSETEAGLRSIIGNTVQLRMLLKEILIGMAYALAAALVAAVIAAGLFRKAGTSRLAAVGIVAAALPGLAGSLVLCLTLIQLLQLPLARFAYKTPLSLLTGLILFLLPRAMALRFLLSSSGNSTGLHLTRLLGESADSPVRDRAREVAWQMRWRGEFWSVAVLSYWVFFDLTLAYLLAPVTIVSAPVMLYNQMHFGKNAILSALVFLTVLVPVLIFAAAAAARRLVMRWF
ncbi:MAG TPA: hypothetical protein VGH74_05795 [Planctomycetaceae bacterium]